MANKSFEAHLQCYIVQNIGRNVNKSLDSIILNGNDLEWIGNEVSCGVGMQRIDVMLSVKKGNNDRLIIPIELKAKEANKNIKNINNIIRQIQRYINWIEQYYIPNRISYIQPMLISKKIMNKNSEYYIDMIENFKNFNQQNTNCFPLKYVEFDINNNGISFKEIRY